jgi:hypothetical protein
MPSKWLAVIYNSNLRCSDVLRSLWQDGSTLVLVFARTSEQPAPEIVRRLKYAS